MSEKLVTWKLPKSCQFLGVKWVNIPYTKKFFFAICIVNTIKSTTFYVIFVALDRKCKLLCPYNPQLKYISEDSFV